MVREGEDEDWVQSVTSDVQQADERILVASDWESADGEDSEVSKPSNVICDDASELIFPDFLGGVLCGVTISRSESNDISDSVSINGDRSHVLGNSDVHDEDLKDTAEN